jgi:hypothetical protein
VGSATTSSAVLICATPPHAELMAILYTYRYSIPQRG